MNKYLSYYIGFYMLMFTFLSVKAYGSEKDLYDFLWLDPDKKVYVLQNKVYEKKGSTYVTAGYGKGLSTDFQDTKVFQFKAGHFFGEEWGVEAVYSGKSHKDDDAFKTLVSSAGNNKVPFIRRINNYYGLMGIWSPFYGKINTFNKIFYFDLNFGLGVSKIKAESNREAFQSNALVTQNSYRSETYSAIMWKGEIRFYITKKLSLDLEFLTNTYKANSGISNAKKFRNNTDGILSIGWSF